MNSRKLLCVSRWVRLPLWCFLLSGTDGMLATMSHSSTSSSWSPSKKTSPQCGARALEWPGDNSWLKSKLKWRKKVINSFSVPSNLNSFITDGKSILLTQPSPPLLDGMVLPGVLICCLYLFKCLFVTGVTCSSFCHTASCLSHFLGGTASGQYTR